MSGFPEAPERKQSWPIHGYAGLALVAVCWVLNWGMPGLRTHLLFFPQWLGYCLVIDSITFRRSGSSLIKRNPRHYAFLFVLSAPVWWIFEGLNLVTANWIYLGREAFTNLEYFLFATLSFSTVIPAVFSSAEWITTLDPVKSLGSRNGFSIQKRHYWRLHAAGWAMLLLLLVYPETFFPFLWLSGFFILDPLNALRGRRSLLDEVSRGDFRACVAYALGALLCGFFWEMWNLYSYPKWIYDIPYLEFGHIFEMPLAGYGGYLPFGWELFAVYHLLAPKSWTALPPR